MEPLAIVMVAVVTPTMLPFKLESVEGAILDSPQTVLRQLGYDEGAMTILGDSRTWRHVL